MEVQTAETSERISPFSSELSKKLLGVYKSLDSDARPKDLLISLLTAMHSNYYTAMNIAGTVAGDAGKGRSTYEPKKAGLMKFMIDDDVNGTTEDLSLELLKNAINGYLSDKMILDGLSAEMKKRTILMVNCLMVQLLSSNIYYLVDGLLIPEYVQESLDNARKYLEVQSMKVFDDFIEDLKELDNEFLIEYVRSIGTEIFGLQVKTKPDQYFNNQLKPFIKRVKNFNQLYKRFLLRREEYNAAAINVNKKNIYPYFKLTSSTYDKGKNTLMKEFALNYDNDVNNLYIQKMILG